MERVYLHINVPNIITVGIIMLVWYMLYGLSMKWYGSRDGNSVAA